MVPQGGEPGRGKWRRLLLPTFAKGQGGSGGARKEAPPQGKYVFFDFENKWQQRVTSDEQIEMDPAQIENELVV